ncbi:MAG: homoserine kinase [Solirubrobacterales bacterium]
MIKVSVPASSANLGPGFDTLGLALPLYLHVTIQSGASGLTLACFGEGAAQIGTEPAGNLFYEAFDQVLTELGIKERRFTITMNNEIPLSRGLGSSAAAILAAVLAANEIAGAPLSQQEVLNRASALEGHPDNIVPALVGGVTVSLVDGPDIHFRRLEPLDALRIAVVIPDFALSTRKARSVQPGEYPTADVVFNLQRACFLVASLATGQLEGLDLAMADLVHQPYRQALIPGFADVIKASVGAGALGAALSGAGPSVIALTAGEPEAVGKAMQLAFARHGIDSRVMIMAPCSAGASIKRE